MKKKQPSKIEKILEINGPLISSAIWIGALSLGMYESELTFQYKIANLYEIAEYHEAVSKLALSMSMIAIGIQNLLYPWWKNKTPKSRE